MIDPREICLTQWPDEHLAEIVRAIAIIADDNRLAPDRCKWAGVSDILFEAANRIYEEDL